MMRKSSMIGSRPNQRKILSPLFRGCRALQPSASSTPRALTPIPASSSQPRPTTSAPSVLPSGMMMNRPSANNAARPSQRNSPRPDVTSSQPKTKITLVKPQQVSSLLGKVPPKSSTPAPGPKSSSHPTTTGKFSTSASAGPARAQSRQRSQSSSNARKRGPFRLT